MKDTYMNLQPAYDAGDGAPEICEDAQLLAALSFSAGADENEKCNHGSRKMRPRSSSVFRSRLPVRVVPARSPSASPSPTRNSVLPLHLPSLLPPYLNDEARPKLGVWQKDAFYTSVPPPEPLCLRALRAVPEVQVVSAATATLPMPQKTKSSKNRHRVRSIVSELVNNLPLESRSVAASALHSGKDVKLKVTFGPLNSPPRALETASLCSTCSSSPTRSRNAEENCSEGPSAAPVSEASPKRHLVSVAVQALTRGTREESSRDAGALEARAKRDAHVWLVMRELRCLRRLNAAVDRAAAAAAATAAAATAAAAERDDDNNNAK